MDIYAAIYWDVFYCTTFKYLASECFCCISLTHSIPDTGLSVFLWRCKQARSHMFGTWSWLLSVCINYSVLKSIVKIIILQNSADKIWRQPFCIPACNLLLQGGRWQWWARSLLPLVRAAAGNQRYAPPTQWSRDLGLWSCCIVVCSEFVGMLVILNALVWQM